MNPASSPLEPTVGLFLFLCIISASAFHLSVCLLPDSLLFVRAFICMCQTSTACFPRATSKPQSSRRSAVFRRFTVDISLPPPPPCCSISFARQAVAVSALEGARRSAHPPLSPVKPSRPFQDLLRGEGGGSAVVEKPRCRATVWTRCTSLADFEPCAMMCLF